MKGYRVWIGRPGSFEAECRVLTSLLQDLEECALAIRSGPADGFDPISDRRLTELDSPPGAVTLFTSGTTGEPKPVTKIWRQILASKKGRGTPQDRWLLTYSPARWAGMSVLAHCIKHGCEIVYPSSLEIGTIAAGLGQCTHVSMTPSLFRKALISGASLENPAMRQVTFGGEPATQAILTQASGLWPHARISHVYASTELGDLVSCSDGKEGYEQLPGDLSDDGELFVGGIPTGDIWTKTGERYLFVGRRSDGINVGGAKVMPFEIEKIINSIPGVLECRVFGVPSPLLGAIVCGEYCGTVPVTELTLLLRTMMPKYAVPRLTQVAGLKLTDAGKVGRR